MITLTKICGSEAKLNPQTSRIGQSGAAKTPFYVKTRRVKAYRVATNIEIGKSTEP
jgi:hypothetical protein